MLLLRRAVKGCPVKGDDVSPLKFIQNKQENNTKQNKQAKQTLGPGVLLMVATHQKRQKLRISESQINGQNVVIELLEKDVQAWKQAAWRALERVWCPRHKLVGSEDET